MKRNQQVRKTLSGDGRTLNSIRNRLSRVANRLNIQTQQDWYSVNVRKLQKAGGRSLLLRFNGSLIKTLEETYPQFSWHPFLFKKPAKYWKDKQNQRTYLNWLSEQLGIESHEDWYSISNADVQMFGGKQLLSLYHGSISKLVQSNYPEFLWTQPDSDRTTSVIRTKKTITPMHLREHFDYFSKKLNIEKQEQWYSFHLDNVLSIVNDSSVQLQGSLCKHLSVAYPEFEWNPLLFPHIAHDYWNKKENIKFAFEWIADILSIEKQEDWYCHATQDVKLIGGHHIVEHFRDTLWSQLEIVYPQFEWNFIRFQDMPVRYQSNIMHQREIMNEIADMFGIHQQEDWYSLSPLQVAEAPAGKNIMQLYMWSLQSALECIYPQYNWLTLFFHHSNSFKDTTTTLAKFFDWISDDVNVDIQDDWYSLEMSDLSHFSDLLDSYNHSEADYPLTCLLSLAYPQYTWFTFEDHNNQRMYLEWLAESLQIQTLDDWVQVSKETLLAVGGRLADRLLKLHNHSWSKALKTLYPDHNWPEALHSSRGQNFVTELLESLLFNQKIHMNYKLTSSIELDIFIPSLSLAFEYQGEQHYPSSKFRTTPSSVHHQRTIDTMKMEVCKSRGISLIEVPYWWYNSPSSLASSISAQRPDIPINFDALHKFEDTFRPTGTLQTQSENAKSLASEESHHFVVNQEGHL